MTTMKKVVLGLGGFMLLVILLNLSGIITFRARYYDKERAQVLESINSFHDHYNSRRYKEIMDSSHSLFKQSGSPTNITRSMNETLDHFGKFEKILESKIQPITATPPEVGVILISQYEKRRATEMYKFILEGSSYKLVSYHIAHGIESIDKALDN